MGKSMVSCNFSPKLIHWQNQSSHMLHDPAAKLVMPRLRREASRPCRGCHNALQGLTGHTATLHLHWGSSGETLRKRNWGHTVPPQEKDGKGLIMFHDSCRNSLFYLVEESCGVAIYIYIYGLNLFPLRREWGKCVCGGVLLQSHSTQWMIQHTGDSDHVHSPPARGSSKSKPDVETQ